MIEFVLDREENIDWKELKVGNQHFSFSSDIFQGGLNQGLCGTGLTLYKKLKIWTLWPFPKR